MRHRQPLVTGWVACSDGREELVAISLEQRDQLLAGQIVCPTCRTACGTEFRAEPLSNDMALLVWRFDEWQASYILR